MTELEEMQRIAQAREELHPDLVSWVEDESEVFGGPFLKHPLCYMMLGNRLEDEGDHVYPFSAMANAAYETKKAGADKAFEEDNWFAYIHIMHERPYRLHAFGEIHEFLSDKDYWELLGGIWTDSENIWQNESEWVEYLHSDRPGKEFMMEEDERAALALLPDEFPIWRGFCVTGREEGASWTTDRKKAIWFAKRLCVTKRGQVPRLASGRALKSDVLAYFMCRGESEVVILPEDVIAPRIEEIPFEEPS